MSFSFHLCPKDCATNLNGNFCSEDILLEYLLYTQKSLWGEIIYPGDVPNWVIGNFDPIIFFRYSRFKLEKKHQWNDYNRKRGWDLREKMIWRDHQFILLHLLPTLALFFFFVRVTDRRTICGLIPLKKTLYYSCYWIYIYIFWIFLFLSNIFFMKSHVTSNHRL